MLFRSEVLSDRMKDFEEMTGKDLPQVNDANVMPSIGRGCYEHQVYDTLLSVEYKPEQVIKMASEKFMTDSVALPVFIYSSDEILDSYVKLTGLEVPKNFYLGMNKGEPKLLVYAECRQNEKGSFVHTLRLFKVCEKLWVREKEIYFDEEQGKFFINF